MTVKQTLLLLVLTLAWLPGLADFSRGVGWTPSLANDRMEQRKLYQDAMYLLRTHQFTRFRKLKPKLSDYALYPYVEYQEMVYRISRYSEDDLLAFAEKHRNTPLVEPLLQHWLGNLARKGRWKTFIANYDRVTPTRKLACHHGYALYKTGQKAAAMTVAAELWTVGFSQPKECDPLFKFWRDNNKGITQEIAWRRYSLSIQANQRKLASYLLRFIARADRTHATDYRLVHLKPATVKRYHAFQTDNSRNREIVLHGIRKLAKTDPEDALAVLRRYESQLSFDPAELEAVYVAIGVQLTWRTGDTELVDSLPVNLHEHPDLLDARLRQSMRLQDWQSVMALIQQLPQAQQESPRWQYWKARIQGQSANRKRQKAAHATLVALSQTRSFYGFVAADILQSDYNYEEEIQTVNPELLRAMESAPGIARALELLALEDLSRARREWYLAMADFTPAERAIAAKVALRWGWYKVAIQTLIDARAWNHLDSRFPFAWQDTFIKHARRADIPVQWSFAVARQESAFMPDAKSRSGALGVMQVMPGTARGVSRKLGVRYAGKRSLVNPDTSIHLGTHYLSQMLRRFDNNRILASAAYNAGPYLQTSTCPFFGGKCSIFCLLSYPHNH